EKEDDIVYVRYANHIAEDYNALRDSLDIPLAVLVNNGSASASEILAGAIKYNDKGTIIGETTYGKGTVQTLFSLLDNDVLKLTTAEYFSADAEPVNGVGIKPDIELPMISEEELEAINGFAPMIDEEISHYGISSLDVFGAQQRLKFLGYDVNLTAKYDQKTSQAIALFQEKNNLKDKYALYPETKNALNEIVISYLNEDPQLEKAIEILTQ
ncbi:MAG: S41 family peptidase, partial [Desulfobacterales bacterium]|nr:S41 family peptidase [Desulfobacterales bacterium]